MSWLENFLKINKVEGTITDLRVAINSYCGSYHNKLYKTSTIVFTFISNIAVFDVNLLEWDQRLYHGCAFFLVEKYVAACWSKSAFNLNGAASNKLTK